MKTVRKTKAEQDAPKLKTGKGSRRVAKPALINGKHPPVSYEHAPVGVVEASLEGKYLNANEEFCRMLGYEKQELLLCGIKDFTHEDDYAIDIRLHQQLVAGTIPFYRLEKRYIRKGGESLWVELTRSLVCDEEGKPVYTVGVVLDISDRKQVERVLRDSVERLRLATEAAQMFMWEWDFEKEIISLADSFEQVLGFSAGLLPKNTVDAVLELSPAEDVQTLRDAVTAAVHSRRDLHSLQYRVINPENGDLVWLETNGKVVYDEQGNAIRMFGVAQNITKSKKAQDEIAIISRFPAEDPNPVMRITPEGKILYANPASTSLLESWADRGYQTPEQLQNAVARAFNSGMKTEVEIELQGRFFSCTLAPIREAGYVNLYGKDVTERKLAEEKQRESEERFRALVSQATAGITESDLNSVLVFVNPRFAEMLGYSEQELLGKSIWELTYPEDLEENQRVFQRMLSEGESYQLEKRFLRKDGSPLWTNVTVSTIRDLDGNPKGGVGVVMDIEERKQAEQALTEYAREQAALYRFVDQLHRTVSLENIYEAALDAILSALQCDRASILLFDETDVMHFAAWRGLSAAYRAATDGHSPWTVDAQNPAPIAMDDLSSADLSESLRATILEEGIRSLAFIPLVSNGRLIGKFMIYYDTPHRFGADELDISLTIARQLAFGVARKRAEEALRASEQRFREIFEAAGVSVWVEDFSQVKAAIQELQAQGVQDFHAYFEAHPDFVRRAVELVRVLDVNTQTLGMLGASSKEDLLFSLNRIFTTETEVAFVEELLALAEGREMVRTETQVRTLQGEPVSVLLTVHFNPQTGDYSRVVVTLTDITERKRMEEALRLENERFMRFVNSNIVGIIIGNADGEVLLANDYYLQLLGVSREEFLAGKVDWRQFTPPEWQAADEKALAELQERGVCEPYEKEYIRSDGTRVPVYIADAMLPGPGGEIAAFILDITERKRAEETLRRNEELFSKLVEAAPFGVYFIDSEFRLRAVNKGSEQVFRGIYPLIGRDFAEILRIVWSEPFATEAIERFRHTLETGESFISPPVIEPRGNIDEIQSYDWQIHRITMPDGTFGVVCYFYDLSEQKKMEAAVRASEALYRTIARSIPGGGVYVLDKDFRYLVAEGPVTDSFGLSREILEGRKVSEVYPADRVGRMEERLQRTFQGETVSFETEHNGRVYWTRQAPLQDSIGHAILVTMDITERKQAEEALRESEERLRAILRQATAGIVRKDAEGRLLFVNQAFCNMLGYTESELSGKTMWDLVLEDDLAENKLFYHRMMLEGVPFKLERRLIRQDGSVIWVDASVSPIMDASGRPQSAVAVEVDITGRKQAEETLQQMNLQLEERVLSRTAKLRAVNQALREEITERKRVEDALRRSEAVAQENEAKLRSLFELLPVGISFLDLDGQVVQLNPALLSILKLSKDEFFNKRYESRRYIRADGTPMSPAEFASARAIAEKRTIFNVETGVVLESGEVVWTSVSAAPVDVADVSVVVVTVDITDSKRAEQALQESHARLRILSQRLVEVQEEERRALARELHDRVGQTLAALNINLIIINSQITAESAGQIGTRLNDSMKLVAETIALVRDVMTDLRPAVLDDYGLEAALESHLTQFISRYDIQARFEKPDPPLPHLGPSVEMTFLRIAQEALMNIARHAQATRVTLSLKQEEESIRMVIQDNGIGIQSWQEANRPGSHGLTIMRERAEAFDGSLQVRSAPGQGTTIEISIPRRGHKQARQENSS
jgi:PAS domain S-box-containing protein